jgi:hypothetical protein
VWQSGGVLFLALKMSQNPLDDVLILNATVRRIDDDFDGSTAATGTPGERRALTDDTF